MSDNENNGPVSAVEQDGGGDAVLAIKKKKEEIAAAGEVKVNAGGDNGISEPAEIKSSVTEEKVETKSVDTKMEVETEASPEKKEAGEQEQPQKSPSKRGRKKKPVKEVDDEEEEELQPGLLERPVVLDDGRKRERKKTDRLETSFNTPGSKGKTLDVPEGSGSKLGEIDNIEYQLRKVHGDDLKPLHRVLYSRAGTTTEVKKNIRKFCGFTFEKNSPEYQKRVQVITKCTMAQLKLMCETLDLERGGTKENIVERLIDFLMSPHSSGKPLKQNKVKAHRKPSGKPRKRRRTKKEMEEARQKEAADRASGKKRSRKRKAASTDDDEEEEEAEAEGSEESAGEEEEEEKKEEEVETHQAPKKKRAKVELPKKEIKKAKEPKAKKAAGDKKTPLKKPRPPKKPKVTGSGDDSAAEDAVSSKQPPSDEELKEVVKKILDGANLEEITMKTVCRQVFDKYPDFDLTSRKDYIKVTVKQIIR
ncbi:hypothetical protein NP493_109g07023 [Ridgeia piscesae]|uniref:Protein DEK n=1 Tax=Ridgeia piscesae TaxID=27915 RepID=A0AAD9UHF4_RIDPI|nr:hypothetical protein NP493_109g07023 [Ridgeia piscesae]